MRRFLVTLDMGLGGPSLEGVTTTLTVRRVVEAPSELFARIIAQDDFVRIIQVEELPDAAAECGPGG